MSPGIVAGNGDAVNKKWEYLCSRDICILLEETLEYVQ